MGVGVVEKIMDIPPHHTSGGVSQKLRSGSVQEGAPTVQVHPENPVSRRCQESIGLPARSEGFPPSGLRLLHERPQPPGQYEDDEGGQKPQNNQDLGVLDLEETGSGHLPLLIAHLHRKGLQ